jgi:hypothetical protein
MSKISMILENIQNKYNYALLEESEVLGEKEVLKGRMLVNEATMTIRKALLEENMVGQIKDALKASWEAQIIEEMTQGQKIGLGAAGAGLAGAGAAAALKGDEIARGFAAPHAYPEATPAVAVGKMAGSAAESVGDAANYVKDAAGNVYDAAGNMISRGVDSVKSMVGSQAETAAQ